METSKTLPTVGRILHIYSEHWVGPRPAIVANAFPESNACNVVVFLDVGNDASAEKMLLGSRTGYTLMLIAVYDPMSEAQRAEMNAEWWAEWMPYQAAQAAKTPTPPVRDPLETTDPVNVLNDELGRTNSKIDDLERDIHTLKDMVFELATRLEKQETTHAAHGLHLDMTARWNSRAGVSGDGAPVEVNPVCVCGFGDTAHYKAPELHKPECSYAKPPAPSL